MHLGKSIPLSACAWCLISSGAFAVTPSFQVISRPYYSTGALDISADGTTVVGYSGSAFRWTQSGGLVLLPGITNCFPRYARGVSGDGSVIVGEATTSANTSAAFRWTAAGGTEALASPSGYTFSQAFGVSANGAVAVGNGGNTSENQAIRWTAGGAQPMGFLPGATTRAGSGRAVSADGAVIVGSSSNPIFVNGEAFRWTDTTGMVGLGVLPGRGASEADSVSADGSVVAGISWLGGPTYPSSAFRWTAQSGMTDLGDLPGGANHAAANDMSADGSVIVGQSESAAGLEAFIWDAQHGMRNLQQVLASEVHLDLTGWRLSNAYGISADGMTIVGAGSDPQSKYVAWVVTLPEPATLLLAAGSALLALRRRNAFSVPSVSGSRAGWAADRR